MSHTPLDTAGMAPGAQVQCRYRPHVGTLLAIDDPRAWAFSVLGHVPTPKRCADHVAWCLAHGLLRESRPVLYEFGVMWDYDLTLIA